MVLQEYRVGTQLPHFTACFSSSTLNVFKIPPHLAPPPSVNTKIPPYRSPPSAGIYIIPKCSQLLNFFPLLPTQNNPLTTTAVSSLPNASLCFQRILLNEDERTGPTKFRTKKVCINSSFPFLRSLRFYKCY